MIALAVVIVLFVVLTPATGGDMRDEAAERDAVERLFRDPFRRDREER